MKVRTLRGGEFTFAYLVIFVVMLMMILLFPKAEIHLFINGFHTHFLDTLMKYWTWLGDGVVLVVFALLMMAFSYRYFFVLLAAYLISGVGAQIFKRLFFSEIPRPVKYFEMIDPDRSLYLVPGVHMHAWHSFPSGHTAAAFAVFFALALQVRSKGIQLLLFIIAAGVGYSRLYLSQHFLVDIFAGSFLGVCSALLATWLINRFKGKWLNLSPINTGSQ